MQLNINLYDKKSINEAINKLKELKKVFKKIDKEFFEQSAKWIINTANANLNARATSFKGTTDIMNCWEIEYKNDNSIIIKNTSDYGALVEFGIGIVGKENPHEKAFDVQYEYDYNNHGENGWTFIRDLNDLSFGKNKQPISMEDVKNNNGRFLFIRNYKGYEGKSYFYDAVFDYLEKGTYKRIYSSIFKKYFKD